MRLGWLTDVHLNFVHLRERAELYSRIHDQKFDAVLVGGDIGEADSAPFFLKEMEKALQVPICFVLGNHDFYRGSIRGIRGIATTLAAESQWLRWLPTAGVVQLTPRTALVGHDSWADGRVGDFLGSEVMLNDYLLIDEFRGLDKIHRLAKLNALGDEAALFLEARVREALPRAKHIVVLTHVPPFREACWHEGRISDDAYLPHFACRAVGERLAAIMSENPGHQMTVLCGHTHSSGTARMLDNLVVLTGAAEYGKPALQQVLEVE